ncbi:hypothetical protein QSV37_04275 [Acinetobacter sp. VNK23]|nr:hypothetical protein [Acinetobacter thutiue]MDM1019527.1 hypothetical protein [Acinetobacter thutiue]
MSKIDTQIRHITQSTDNIFADLGLDDADHNNVGNDTYHPENISQD